jgi:hypothetical protein
MAATIGPGVESVGVLLWAADPDAARWQRSNWGGADWSSPAWQSVGCDVSEAQAKWGSSQEAGILSVAEAAELDVTTYDPLRQLDPLNTSSPYYGAVRPGTPIRLVGYAPGEIVASTGYIDEVSYDLASARGRIRAIGGIAYLAQAQVPAGVVLPNTLRARTRAIVAAVGLSTITPVEPESTLANLVVNGNFDASLDGWTGTTQCLLWLAAPPSGGPGGGAARITGDGVANYPTLRQTFAVEPGATYAVALTSRPSGATTSTALARVDGLDDTGATVASGLLSIPMTQGGGSWVAYAGNFTAPANVFRVTLFIYINAAPAPAGHIWDIDAVSVTGTLPGSTLEADPPVSPYDATKTPPAWQAISDAALDALWYVWSDPTGTIRFRSWGALVDAPISVGCPPADADPGDVWLLGLSTIETTAAGDAVRNSVRAYSAGTTWQPARQDANSIRTYGPRPFDVDRVVPSFTTWADRILADRADAGLDIAVGELRPYTEAELAALLNTSLVGPSIIRVRDDAHGELVDIDVGMIGARVGVTPVGWRFGLATLISRVAWEDVTPAPPIIPPIPPPDPYHTETRTYIATSDALLALTSGGAKYGAGAANSLPFGTWAGWTYRSLLAFPSIPWTKVRRVVSATLKLQTSTQVRVGFGSSPKSDIRRITSGWSAGSSSTPSGSNAVVWPGPNVTSSGAVTASLGTAQSAAKSIRVDAIARAWAPASAGGSGAAQYGIRLGEYSSSGSNTGEVWPLEQGGSARPTLELVVEVFD